MDPSTTAAAATLPVAPFPLPCVPSRIEPANQNSADGFHLGYRRWLDGLRGVAILLVLAYHLGFLSGGFLGVDIFFVLSGFLITSLLLEEWQSRGAINLKRFYLRRALRLLPAFAVVLLLCGLSILWLPSGPTRAARGQEVALAACYLSNWPLWHRNSMPILRHTWSLSVEEQFYLLWPMLLYGALRLGLTRRRILMLVCCGIAGAAVWRWGLFHGYQHRDADHFMELSRLYMGLDTRADALLVGCLLGLLTAWDLLPKSRHFIRWTGAAALVGVVYLGYLTRHRSPFDSPLYHGQFTAVAVLTAIVLARLLSAPVPIVGRILESAPLVGTGRISYALYLFHLPISYILVPVFLQRSYAVLIVLVIVLSFLAALLSYYLVERPCLRLKERLRPRSLVLPLVSLRLPESDRPISATQAVA